ncbi:MAG: chemotaxis protein methyltransferase CheR [Chthoniobacter sp.]|jgi:chemotaxis protein methyltransferase CheR|nr:chemotaxis protein methyltransferase CheR [Chthoniobacter sp.]
MSLLPPGAHALSADPHFPRLKDYLIANTGLAYYIDKDEQLATHVAKRIAGLRLPDCASYLRLLQSDEIDGTELDKLIATLTIGETFFFRHHEAFDALRDVVFPDLIRRNQAIRKLRIWSAGCSIGAEPYSIAILLKRDLGHLLAGWEISIVATDINRDFLDRARAGKYEEWAFRSVPDEIKSSCFSKSGSSWVIDPRYQESISFQYHNLVKDPCPSLRNHLDGFDLIVCRNVTIYFSQQTVRDLVQELYFSLPDNGWLLVGHAEPNVEVYRSFRAVNLQGAVLYQKTNAEPAAPAWTQPPPFSFVPQPVTLPPLPAAPRARAPALASRPSALRERRAVAARAPEFSPSPELAAIQQMADQGDLEQAAQSCEKLLEREKLNPVAHFYYALVLEQMGRRRETQESLRRAIYLDRSFIVAHYYLGLIQQRVAEPKQALRCFRNVLDLLSGLKADQPIPAADEFTVAELKQLTQMHINALPKV